MPLTWLQERRVHFPSPSTTTIFCNFGPLGMAYVPTTHSKGVIFQSKGVIYVRTFGESSSSFTINGIFTISCFWCYWMTDAKNTWDEVLISIKCPATTVCLCQLRMIFPSSIVKYMRKYKCTEAKKIILYFLKYKS